MKNAALVVGLIACMASCESTKKEPLTAAVVPPSAPQAGTFGDDVAFLRAHTAVVVLGDAASGAAVAVAPDYQGRVMTSTAEGEHGASFGFINREVVAAGVRQPHITVFGGEDRFWLGPEGGQFALYFPPGVPYDFAHWQVPEAIDWGPWTTTGQTGTEVSFARDIAVTNHAGTELRMRVVRTVRLLSAAELATHLGAAIPQDAAVVGYESVNAITNTGTSAWSKKTGLPSVWILGMYKHSPTTTVVIPFRPGPEATLGRVVNDAYFGKIPPDRLRVGEGVLFFSADGQKRGKIGIPAPRALPSAGSYDSGSGVLTIVQYTRPESGSYVNSMWEDQADPFAGDVVNSYNDGPPSPGAKPLGPFYELETSSPGAELAPGQILTHVHRTMHVQGPKDAVDPIAKRQLGVGVEEISHALAR